jgi:hypothetical protein
LRKQLRPILTDLICCSSIPTAVALILGQALRSFAGRVTAREALQTTVPHFKLMVDVFDHFFILYRCVVRLLLAVAVGTSVFATACLLREQTFHDTPMLLYKTLVQYRFDLAGGLL